MRDNDGCEFPCATYEALQKTLTERLGGVTASRAPAQGKTKSRGETVRCVTSRDHPPSRAFTWESANEKRRFGDPLPLTKVVVLPVVLNYLWLSDFADLFVRIVRWPAMFLVVALALACIYRFLPPTEARNWPLTPTELRRLP